MARELDFVPIEGFPPGEWRLDWLGGIRKNPHQPDDYEVELQFSQLTNRQVEIFSPEATLWPNGVRSDICRFWMTVGYMPALLLGSVWEAGRPIRFSPSAWGALETLTPRYPLKVQPWGLRRMRARQVIPENTLLGPDFADSWCRTYPFGPDNEHGLIIPVSVLLGFYYCSSSKLANLLFSGGLDRSVLVVPSKTGIRSDGLFQLYLRAGFYDEDAPTIFRLICSTTAYDRAVYIHRSLRVPGSKGLAWVDADVPFTGETLPVFHGRWLPKDGRQRGVFLVMRIARCTHPFPYERLGVERENPGGVASGRSEGDEGAGFSISALGVSDSARLLQSGGGRSGRRILKLTLPAHVSFSFFEEREIVYLYRDRRTAYDGHGGSGHGDSDEPLALGAPDPSVTTRPASLSREGGRGLDDASGNEDAAPIEPWFEALLQALVVLESQGVAWMVKEPVKRRQGRQVIKTPFPRQLDEHRLQWLFLDAARHRRRAGMWVQVQWRQRYFYLFELERRPDEHYGLYILQRLTSRNGWASDEELVALMQRWGRGRAQQTEQKLQDSGWRRNSIHHTVNQSLSDLADRIGKLLERQISPL